MVDGQIGWLEIVQLLVLRTEPDFAITPHHPAGE